MKRSHIILLLSLFPLLLSGCYLEYRFDDGAPKAIKNIPYYFRVELDYSGLSGQERLEYFETEAPYYDNFNWKGSYYGKPSFRYNIGDTIGSERKFFPENITFHWVLDGGKSYESDNPLKEILLTALSPQIESGRLYNGTLPDSLSSFSPVNICLLTKNNEKESDSWSFSFTKVYDDDTIAYTLRLYAPDPLRQPQKIQIDFSKKLMAIRGVAQNFQEYIIL